MVVAPDTQSRFVSGYRRRDLTLLTAGDYEYATLQHLQGRLSGNGQAHSARSSVHSLSGYYLESFLKVHGYDATLVTECQTDTALERALTPSPLAVAVSTTFIHSPKHLARLLGVIERLAPGARVVVGGPLIWKQRQLMQRALDFEEHDDLLFTRAAPAPVRRATYIAHEFGEHTLLAVLRCLDAGSRGDNELAGVANLVMTDGTGGWGATESRSEPVNLDRDITRWDLVERLPPHAVPIRTNAGCRWQCGFCDYHPLHAGMHLRSAESVIHEVKLAQARGATEFSFVDDEVLVSKKRVQSFLGSLGRRELGIEWAGYFRVDQVSEDTIDDLWRSGCRAGFCGIESGDPGQLLRMKKGATPEAIKRGIELCNQAGISTVLGVIVGFPGESQQSLDTTAAFLNGLGTDSPGFSSFRIAPLSVPPLSPMASPGFREKHGLKGSGSRWRHPTMTSEEAQGRWADYLFDAVSQLPYGYVPGVTLRQQGASLPGAEHPPELSVSSRNTAFGARRELTQAFLKRAPDGELQRAFSRLCGALERDPKPWAEVLAEREVQPGSEGPTRGIAMALARRAGARR